MQVHPSIAALRGDWASQHRVQSFLLKQVDAWRGSEQTCAISGDLERYSNGEALPDCSALYDLLSNHKRALQWVEQCSAIIITALRDAPFGEVPFPSRHTDDYSTVQLLSHGSAILALSAYHRRPDPIEPKAALLVDRESTEFVLKGSARGLFHEFEFGGELGAKITTTHQDWSAGAQIELTPENARHLVEIEETLIVLQLTRSAAKPRPTREYQLADGRLTKSASGDKQASRDFLGLAVLGALEHRAATPAMEQLTLAQDRDPDLRWEAMRQLLALDPAMGVTLLSTLAKRSEDPLAEPAAKLRSQLIAAHPQLANLPLETA